MGLETSSLHKLLGSDVASGEKNRRRHGLSEQGPGSQSAIIPARDFTISIKYRLGSAIGDGPGHKGNSPAEESRHGVPKLCGPSLA